jgi:membrane protease YdiL (CAAX protease family)
VRRGLLAIAVLYASYFLVVPIAGHYLVSIGLGPSFELVLALLLGQATLLVLTVLFAPGGQWRSVLGWRRVPLRWGRMTGAAALYVGASFLLGLLSLVIMSRLGLPLETARQEVLESVFQTTDPLIVWLTPLALAIIAPFGEELFFRGLVYGLLRPAGRFWATAVSAVAFAVLHLEPAAFLGHLGFGVYLASLREQTGSVWPSVATHGIANLALYVLAQVAGQLA